MSKIKFFAAIAVALSFSVWTSLVHSEVVEKPAVEKIEAPFPVEFSGAGNLFEDAPMARFDEPIEYQIKKGEKLRDAMTRWTEKAGYELVWQPTAEDGDIIFAANMSFTDSFEKASEAFFNVVRMQTKFDGKLHSNKVLRVFVANAKR